MAVEFARNVTFGQYLDLGSPIHRLDPRIKMVATGLLMFAGIIARSYIAFVPLVIAVIIIQVLSQIPLSYTLRGMRLLFNTMLIIFSLQVLFFPNPVDPFWQWWVFSLSVGGIVQGLFTMLRVLVLYYLTTTLMYTTPMVDIADGSEVMLDPLKRLRVPVNELVMVMVIALKFVPLLIGELERLVKAQAARGSSLGQGNLIERTRRVGAVLIPLFVGALARAEVLTMAMEARCYRGGQGRTKRRILTLRRIDLIALALMGLLAVSSIVIGRLSA